MDIIGGMLCSQCKRKTETFFVNPSYVIYACYWCQPAYTNEQLKKTHPGLYEFIKLVTADPGKRDIADQYGWE